MSAEEVRRGEAEGVWRLKMQGSSSEEGVLIFEESLLTVASGCFDI
jgi:hypothetical protein